MNPGFMSLWIVLILFILIATGWKPYLAPEISRRTLAILGIVMVLLLSLSIWWSPFSEHIQVELHVSVCFLMLVSLLSYKGSDDWSYIGYLILCTMMIAVIWGFIRKMYSFDPIFHWVGPSWDAPLLTGIFCGAFTSQAKHQCGMLVWGAVLGETLNAHLQSRAYTAHLGSLSWWDSFWIALAAARLFSLLLKTIRIGTSKLSLMLMQIKGGRPS
ncbi:hypothetical protein [Bacillus sp. FJAT-26390]|uniref:YphA family membrane protein n=1 Tax=Bacillus sp. FJAT-26390 TaxID=1743142 RepID=UPI000807FA5B|nr:hypothetical protein [Bacillus sp. FJAT-26390]OBZ17810.1 hypothetical protein A7975_08200 [Bacillus sp. FJAT-26390]